MKTFILMLSVAALIVSAEVSFAADVHLQTGVHYDWWDDTKDNKASQFYIPLRIGTSYDQFSFSILTGHAYTRVEFPDQGSKTLSHVLDTKLNMSYEMSEKLPVDMLVGLGVNLPTGKTDFQQDELILIMDSDLISINKFGEGYNVNPTVSIAKQWGDWVAGAGVGYLWRGEYDYSKSLKNYDPGDMFNTNAELGYFYSEELHTRVFAQYVWYGKDKVDGEDFYQEGQFFLLGLGCGYEQEKWDADVSLKSIFRDKSKFQDISGGIFTEDKNNHGDEWIGDITVRYFLDGKTTLNTSLQARYITDNDYSRSSSMYVGSREKYTLGAGIRRIFTPALEGELSIKGFVMHDDEAQFPEPRDSNNYRGVSPAVYLISRF